MAKYSQSLRIGYLLQNGIPDLSTPSGPKTHITRIVQGLHYRGHPVRLVRLTAAGVKWSDDSATWHQMLSQTGRRPALCLIERPMRLVQTLMPALPYFNYFDSLRFADAARSILAGVDLLYERYGFMGYGGVLLSRQLKVPLLLEVNGHPFDEMHHTVARPLRGLQRYISHYLTRWTLANASMVLPSGYGWQNRLVETGLLDRTHSQVVWPGTDYEIFAQKRDLEAVRRRWQIGQGSVITFVGSFDRWQGLETLVTVFAQLQPQMPNNILLLAGDGPIRLEIETLVEKLGCSKQVRFLGYLAPDALSEVLAVTDIGVQLYEKRVEFVGMKLFDYMACGTAIIVTAPKRQHDLIVHEETGMVIEPGNKDELREVLLRLLRDPELQVRLGTAARRVIAQGHTWKHRVVEIENLAYRILEN